MVVGDRVCEPNKGSGSHSLRLPVTGQSRRWLTCSYAPATLVGGWPCHQWELAEVTNGSLQPSLGLPEMPSLPGRAKGSRFREPCGRAGRCHDDGAPVCLAAADYDSSGAAAPAARVLGAGGCGPARLGGRRRVVSGAGWRERGRASGRPGSLTDCACRQQRGPGTSAAGAEEQHCTVERRADLTYAEFIQQYVRPPALAAPPCPKPRPGARSAEITLLCAGLARPGFPRPPPHDLERTRGGGGRGGRGSDPAVTLPFLPAMPSPDPSSCRGSRTTR